MPEATSDNMPGNDLIYRLPSHLYPPFIYRLTSTVYPPLRDLSPRPSLPPGEREKRQENRPHTEIREAIRKQAFSCQPKTESGDVNAVMRATGRSPLQMQL